LTALLWLRRDLRVGDHPALLAAAEEGPVLPLFVRDPRTQPGGEAARSRLEASLAAWNVSADGALVVRSGDPVRVVAEVAAETGARTVHVTAGTTPGAREQDRVLAERLRANGVELVAVGTPYAVDPGTVRTASRTPYRVFTPFARAWRDVAVAPPSGQPTVRWHRAVEGEGLDAALVDRGRAFGPVGEVAALERWRAFVTGSLSTYSEGRDRPDLDGTSRLSAHLSHGEIHPRTLLDDLRRSGRAGSPGAQAFVTELAWREFYADVLWHHPESAWRDLGSQLSGMTHDEGPDVEPLVEAWRAGRTGFPFVDAGMRQLLATGWMHNRLRMVVASFLVKDLHVPWQVGARHFRDHLLDFDLASNSHGWQWVAGTGTDAAPYFRIFNPVSQGKRLDPQGDFVRRWVPELAHLPGAAVHEPWRHDGPVEQGYPQRVVDHAEERREALDRYAQARGKSAS
jgi:deoxyribodipyrimidine photo-lyase